MTLPRLAAGRCRAPDVIDLAVAVLVVLLILNAGSVRAQADACPEPNDDPSMACPLAIGGTVQGVIDHDGDTDVYRVTADGPGLLRLELAELPADYDLYLIDETYEVIGRSVRDGTAREQIEVVVKPGTLYAYVRADVGRAVDTAHQYMLHLTFSAATRAGDRPGEPQRVALSDDFDDPAAGRLARAGPAPLTDTLRYVDGEYSIRALDPTRNWQVVTVPGIFADATLAVDARIIGPLAGRSMTLELRAQPVPTRSPGPSSYKLMVYPGTREFLLARIDSGTVVPLAPRQVSIAIQRDHQTNHLELTCMGSTIIARANGVELARVEDATYREGRSTIIVSGMLTDMPHAELRLDNLVVYRL